jgi:hypothetical protein
MAQIFEDCYGKLTVRDMFQEVAHACARCRSMEPSPMMGSDAMMAIEKPKKPVRKPVTVFYPVGQVNIVFRFICVNKVKRPLGHFNEL